MNLARLLTNPEKTETLLLTWAASVCPACQGFHASAWYYLCPVHGPVVRAVVDSTYLKTLQDRRTTCAAIVEDLRAVLAIYDRIINGEVMLADQHDEAKRTKWEAALEALRGQVQASPLEAVATRSDESKARLARIDSTLTRIEEAMPAMMRVVTT